MISEHLQRLPWASRSTPSCTRKPTSFVTHKCKRKLFAKASYFHLKRILQSLSPNLPTNVQPVETTVSSVQLECGEMPTRRGLSDYSSRNQAGHQNETWSTGVWWTWKHKQFLGIWWKTATALSGLIADGSTWNGTFVGRQYPGGSHHPYVWS